MKKLTSWFLTAALVMSLIPGVMAADTRTGDAANHAAQAEAQTAADALNALGLFSGTGTDAQGNPIYELDRQPTRQEAITMLVKLVGGAEESAKGGWSTPFTDVDDWAKNWVGYAYSKGLTAGTSATTFGANDQTTAAQYLTFVLKALGYDANSDFIWNSAWSLAEQVGISNGEYNAQSAFTRGDVAIISYRALFAKMKGTDTPLGDVVFASKEGDLSLNAVDAAILDTSIRVLEDATDFGGLNLAGKMYVHAFTCSIGSHFTSDAPAQLAAGTASDKLKAVVVTCDELTEDVLMTGDILFAGDDLYIYGAGSLRSLNGMGAPKVDTAKTLASITDYTLLRPALGLPHLKRSEMFAKKPDVLTPQQQAVVSTAKAYWLRGERVQYADTRFAKGGGTLATEFRWQSTVKAPEDCTLTDWGYTNCAAFTYEVYYQAFGFKLPNKMYTTSNLAKYASQNGTEVFVYDRDAGSTQTEEEKAKVKAEFLAALQPGDLVCIRREDGTGHVLLYIGNGELIHSSGYNYKYTDVEYGIETTEASIRRVLVENYFFNPELTPRGDVFSVAKKLSVIRPLNIITDSFTENTKNRMANLEDIVAEKLSSHVRAQTADKGEEITFTYALHNFGEKTATLEISEAVPAELEWVSGGTRSGDTLTWTVEVPAGERVSVSYTAKVKEDVAYGTQIQSTASTVGGVTVKCAPIRVGKKLTEAQQTDLIRAYKNTNDTGLTGFARVNELYKQATGVENIFADTDLTTIATGENGCFQFYKVYKEQDIFKLNAESSYGKMLPPGLYGGRRIYASQFANDRTRMPKEQDLQIGDVLLGKNKTDEVWLYLGQELGLVSLTDPDVEPISIDLRLERLLAYQHYFAVLRPMQALETAG